MTKQIITQTISTLRVIAISSLTIFTLYTVEAWVGPTLSAPNGNVAGPITTSATNQTKTGNLTVGKLCLSGVCNATWPSDAVTSVNGKTGAVTVSGGDNLGNHVATATLNMNGNAISSVGSFSQNFGNYFYLPGLYSPYKGILSAGDGKVLTSDALGFATWQYPQTPAGVVTSVNGMTGAVTVNASGLGVGQSWQDVKANRIINTDYVNSTGKPIEISITPHYNDYIQAKILVDGVVVAWSYNDRFAGYRNMTAIVPSGSTYQVQTSATVIVWSELR